MNNQNTRCNDELLFKLLHSDQDSDDDHAAAAHLEHCPRCQARLEALAAEPQDWQCVQRASAAGSHGHTVDASSVNALNLEMGGRIPEWFHSLLTTVPLCGSEIGKRPSKAGNGTGIQFQRMRALLKSVPGKNSIMQ